MVIVQKRCDGCGIPAEMNSEGLEIYNKWGVRYVDYCEDCLKTKNFIFVDKETEFLRYNRTYTDNYSTLCPKK